MAPNFLITLLGAVLTIINPCGANPHASGESKAVCNVEGCADAADGVDTESEDNVPFVVSMLQTKVAPPAASKDSCLTFIHNPRTGGTTIDSQNLHLPKDQRAYHSLMEVTLDKAAASPEFQMFHAKVFNDTQAMTQIGLNGKLPYSAGEIFDEAHGSELKDESSSSAAQFYGQYIPILNFRFVTWTVAQEFGGYEQTCQDLHTPPQFDEKIDRFIERPGCTSFCSVRDPMSRLLSTYKFRAMGQCSNAAFDQWIQDTFPLKEPISFCHAYPQVEYVYNRTNGVNRNRVCDRIIRFENFAEEYNALMKEFGRPLRLSTHFLSTHTCHIDTNAISQKAKDLVYDYYRPDYETFGYPRP